MNMGFLDTCLQTASWKRRMMLVSAVHTAQLSTIPDVQRRMLLMLLGGRVLGCQVL
jgi:hypothetical protein